MNKHALLSLAFLVLSTLLGACTKQAEVAYISEGEEFEKVKSISAPYAEHILDGIAADDHLLFITDFDEKMVTAMDESQFALIVKTYEKLGDNTSVELINIEDREAYYGVNYKVTYPEKTIIMLIVIDKKEPNLVSGLWFR